MKFPLRGSTRGQIVAACAIVAVALSTSPAFAAQRAKFQTENRVPGAVKDGTAKLVSHADPDQQYELAIALPVHDQAGLDALIPTLYDKASPNYHHFLSVQQFADRFAPSPADYAKVVKFAKDNGFNVTVQHANRLAVSFTGTTEQVERAFHVTMNNYQHPSEDRTFYAPDREPTVSGLNVPLLLIAGLDNYVLPHPRNKSIVKENGVTRRLSGGALNSEAIAKPAVHSDAATVTCYGAPYTVNVGSGPCGTYIASDLRTAYGVTALTGSGQNIGIFALDNGAWSSDLAAMAGYWNETTPTVTYLLGSAPTKYPSRTGDGEQTLDVVMSHGMAPSANIYMFENASNDLTIVNAMASSTTCQVYSSSWGWASTNFTAEDTDFKEMSAQGQTYLNATGDSGGYSGYYDSTNGGMWYFPSGDPYIIQVGGTQLITTTNGGSWSGEKAWPDGSGGVAPATAKFGGTTNYGVNYAQPAWQTGVANSTNAVSSTNRTDPDVAAQADFEYIGCEDTACEDTYGGTSYATPLWAGIIAGMNTVSQAAGNGNLGFVNYQLYAAGFSANGENDIFHDVTACGGVDTDENPDTTGPGCNPTNYFSTTYPAQGYNAETGYDGVTGWGAPNGTNLIGALTVPVYSISPTSGTTATSFTNTITFPDANGTVTFYAKVGTSGTPVSVGTCTLTSTTCNGSFTGSTLGVGTYNGYAVYPETETYGPTTRTVNKTSNLMSFTIADNVSVSASASPSSITTAQSSTITGTVVDSSNSANILTGSVSFAAGATNLGSCTLSAGTCNITVAGSTLGVGSYTIVPTYTPAAGYTVTSTTDASLSVTSTGPANGYITFTSVSHNFGQVAVGTAATSYSLKVTNTGTAAYPFSLVFTPANGFTTATNCPASIAAGANCELAFYFTPTATGPVSATWSLASETGFGYTPSNGGTLQGSGTSQGGVSLTTNGHNFGTVAVGTTSATYGTELSNSTTSTETISLGTASAPFHMVTNCGTTLAAGSSCEIEFTYQPTTTSPVSQVVPLSGTPTAITSGGVALPNGGITLSGN